MKRIFSVVCVSMLVALSLSPLLPGQATAQQPELISEPTCGPLIFDEETGDVDGTFVDTEVDLTSLNLGGVSFGDSLFFDSVMLATSEFESTTSEVEANAESPTSSPEITLPVVVALKMRSPVEVFNIEEEAK